MYGTIKIKMCGESGLVMNFRLCRKPNVFTKIKLSRLELAAHLVIMSNYRTVKEVFLVDQMEE
jgi:hypothetical protein